MKLFEKIKRAAETWEKSMHKTGGGRKSRREGERQEDGEQGKGGLEYLELDCGNLDKVFMDVYLSASPAGSSHFPLGNSLSADQKFLMRSRKAGGQLSDKELAFPEKCSFSSASVYMWCLNLKQNFFCLRTEHHYSDNLPGIPKCPERIYRGWHQSLVKIQRSCKCQSISVRLHTVTET